MLLSKALSTVDINKMYYKFHGLILETKHNKCVNILKVVDFFQGWYKAKGLWGRDEGDDVDFAQVGYTLMDKLDPIMFPVIVKSLFKGAS